MELPEASAPADRLQRAPVLVPERIAVSAERAFAALERDGAAGQIRLTSFDGRPVYRFGGGVAAAWRRRGLCRRRRGVGEVDDAMVDRAAARWVGRPVGEAQKALVEDVDQWTVGGAGRSQRPLYKYSWPDGQQAYVSGVTADVVQYTTTSSRFWAYLGAIPHWLYFTPIRKNAPEWFSFVVWSSLIGTVAALMGVVIAVWMYSPRQRYRHAGAPTSIPYKGWKRWHTITGLIFGVVTTTWAFSGLLSMGPFPIMQRLTELTVPSDEDEPSSISSRPCAAGPLPLSAYDAKPPAMALASVREFQAKDLEFTLLRRGAAVSGHQRPGDTRVIPVHGEPMPASTPTS